MQITGFNPDHGPPQTQVTIDVEDLPDDATGANTTVALSGTTLIGVPVVDTAQGTVTVTIEQNSQSGDFIVMVQSPTEGFVHAQSAEEFTVDRPAHEPTLTRPQPATVTAGTMITLIGTNLGEIEYVTIGTTNVFAIIHSSATQIRLRVPQGLAAGTYRIYGRSQEFGRVNCARRLTVVEEQAQVQGY